MLSSYLYSFSLCNTSLKQNKFMSIQNNYLVSQFSWPPKMEACHPILELVSPLYTLWISITGFYLKHSTFTTLPEFFIFLRVDLLHPVTNIRHQLVAVINQFDLSCLLFLLTKNLINNLVRLFLVLIFTQKMNKTQKVEFNTERTKIFTWK